MSGSEDGLHVLLRPVDVGDLDALYEHQADLEATTMAGFPARDRPAFDAHWAKVLELPDVRPLAVVADGALFGYVGAYDFEGHREIGYWLGRQAWGRGIATAAVRLLLENENTRPINAGVAPHNRASVRALEKCGFTCVGVAESDGFLLFELDA